MKKILKLSSLVVVATLILTSCGSANDTSGDTTTDTSGDTASGTRPITMWQWKGNEEVLGINTSDIEAVNILAERTGVEIDWINPSDAATEFQAIMTSGQDMPDAIMYKYTPQTMFGYAKNARIIDLAPYLDEHLPNLKKLLAENEDLEKQIVSEDGQILYLPWITQGKYYFEGPMMRKDWLEATGMEVPTTTDELYNVLKKQKELFDAGELPNAGESFYGLSGYPTQTNKLIYGFNTTNDFLLTEDGHVVYGPTTDEYREAMEWYYKLSTEGLLDPDLISFDSDIYMSHHTNNLTSIYVDGYANFQEVERVNPDIEYIPVPYMTDDNGNIMEYNSTTKRIAQPYGYAISQSAAEDEEVLANVLKVFDYLYSDEGQELMSWGVEGETFEVVDGNKQYTDKIMADPDWSPGLAASKYLKSDLGNTDLAVNAALVDERGRETFGMWENTDYSLAMEPTLWTTDEETEVINTYLTDIKTFKDEYEQKFQTGTLDPSDDAVWEEFQNGLKTLNVEVVTENYDAAYQRFNAR
ncbi:MAG: hypothetical protein ACK5LY_09320 [Lachnospirales bacterium]